MHVCVAVLREEFGMSKLINSSDFVNRYALSREASQSGHVTIDGAVDNVVSAGQLTSDLIVLATAPAHWNRDDSVGFFMDWEEREGGEPVIWIPADWKVGTQVSAVLKAELASSFANQHVILQLALNPSEGEYLGTDPTLFDFAVATPRVRIVGAVGNWEGRIPASVAGQGADLLLRLGPDRQAGEIVSLYGAGSAPGGSWVEHIEIKEADLQTGLRVHLSPEVLTPLVGGHLTIFYTVLVLGNHIQGRQSTFEVESHQPRPFFPSQKREGRRDSGSFDEDLDAFIQPYEGMAAKDRLTFSVGVGSDKIMTQHWLYSERVVQPEEVGQALHWHVPRALLPISSGVLSVLIERGSGLPVIGLMDFKFA